MNRTKLAFVIGASVLFVAACSDTTATSAGSTNYSAILNAASEVPATTATAASGSFSAALHPTNGTLSYALSWTGLTSGTNLQAHIHGPADAATNANVIIDFRALPTGSNSLPATFPTTTTSSISGNINLASLPAPINADSLGKLLDAGKLYVNIHTTANGNGEIRGQITRAP